MGVYSLMFAASVPIGIAPDTGPSQPSGTAGSIIASSIAGGVALLVWLPVPNLW